MYFNVSQLLMELSGSSRSYEIDENAPAIDGVAGGVTGTVRMMKTDKGIWVTATLESVVRCECSRCLDEFRQPIRMALEEEFYPLEEPAGKDSQGRHEESFTIDRSRILDLTEAIRQYAAMSVPMKPICRPDCQGLCPTCGSNLNETSCQCDNASYDPRWGALLDLVPDGEPTKMMES